VIHITEHNSSNKANSMHINNLVILKRVHRIQNAIGKV